MHFGPLCASDSPRISSTFHDSVYHFKPLTSHTLTVASNPQLMIFSPNHTTPFTPSLCAFVALTLAPGSFRLHTKIFVSRLPLTACVPASFHAIDVIFA